MGKVPIRLKEVVYMVSPFEVTILNGLFKDFGKKVHKNVSEVRSARRSRAPGTLALGRQPSFAPATPV